MIARWRADRLACQGEPSSASEAIPAADFPRSFRQFLPRHFPYLVSRLFLLALLFTLELVPITLWLDGQMLVGKAGLLTVLAYSGSWILRGGVAFAAIFVTIA